MKQYIGTFERITTYKVILTAKNEENFIQKGTRLIKSGEAEIEEDDIEIVDVYDTTTDDDN